MWEVEKIVSKGDYNYAIVRGHPKATKNGYVLHHRIVMENALKRPLLDTEIVHHKNHNKKDNRKSNLEVMDGRIHGRLHRIEIGEKWVKLRCPWCDDTFRRQHNKTHLVKPSKYKCSCCSSTCRGKFYRYIQIHSVDRLVARSIKENVVKKYRKFMSL